ncbi:arylsulfatase A-like enzyme [Endozoicomonas sp. NE40]|uniref:Arylsulfatase A-like enzyme n=2 Tax=Endozoicomonas lisbonensis TaxID=3120522 RepID=A0ABV2SCA9_9GAMM
MEVVLLFTVKGHDNLMTLPSLKKAALGLTFSALACSASAGPVPAPRPAELQQQPNIVIIFTDDMGWGDVGYHGFDDIKTPNIDKLAANGAHFPQAYVSESVCAPSRSGMLTGVYQQRMGIYGNSSENHIPRDQPLAMEIVKDQGYATAVIGKWHLGDPTGKPNERGADFFYGFLGGSHDYFRSQTVDTGKLLLAPIYRDDEVVPPIQEQNGYLTEMFTDEAVGFIERSVKKDRSFFLYLAHLAVHHPWQVPESYVERLKDLPVKEGVAGEERRHFAGMVLALDDSIGQVMDTLKEQGVYDNTLIVFMSDNGTPAGQGFAQPRRKKRNETTMSSPGPFNGFKGTNYEGGIRVPFVMQWPGVIPAGLKYEPMVSALDIVPTIASLFEGTNTGMFPFDGTNLLPYLRGEKPADAIPHETLYWRRNEEYAIRDGDWKLTFNRSHGPRTIRLFNMAEDPGEWDDLVGREPEKAQKLKDKFDAWEASLPVNRLSHRPTNRNFDYDKGHRVNVKEFNRNTP